MNGPIKVTLLAAAVYGVVNFLVPTGNVWNVRCGAACLAVVVVAAVVAWLSEFRSARTGRRLA